MMQREREYIELKGLMAQMSAKVTIMIEQAIQALAEQNTALAKSTIELDIEVDILDIKIEEICIKILALYEPKAIDLRYILTASRIIVDLERIGDYCVNICRELINITQSSSMKPTADLFQMGEIAIEMIKDSIEAFFHKDTQLAQEVISEDDKIDALNDKVLQDLLGCATDESKNVQSIMRLMVITRSLERIGDHATSIGEFVYFMVKGKIIRHAESLKKNNE